MNVGDHIVQRLGAWGIRRIFGYPGDGINGVMGALRRAGDRFDFVQVAHEELAGLMATAHAKFTGEVGVCIATSGPGAIHLLNGLYDAKGDHMPVVAIVGQQPLAGLGGSEQQEVGMRVLMEDVAAYVETIANPEQVRHVLDRAFRIALGERTVTVVIVPHDVQREAAVPEPEREHGHQHSSPAWSPPRILPQEGDLRRAAEILNAGQRPAVLIGAGAHGAAEEIARLADALGAGVAKALLGKDVLPDDLPFVTGSVGYLGTMASNTMLKECDTLLMIGTSFPYAEFLPPEGQARGVQIDVDPRNLALRYPVEVALAGDSRETVAALLTLVDRGDRAPWRDRIRDLVRQSRETADRQSHTPAAPINPQRVAWELARQLPPSVIATADSGTTSMWLARDVPLKEGMRFSVSGSLATMGCGIPYALAAKLAYPDRPVVALVGDGAMQMSGFPALVDVRKHREGWTDRRFVIAVFNNRDLNFVSYEQRVMEGEPRWARSQSLPDLPYARIAEAMGLAGRRVERPEEVADAWRQALAADGPFVLDFVVDPDVPALPGTLKKEQAEKLDQALQEDPEGPAIRRQMALQGITTE